MHASKTTFLETFGYPLVSVNNVGTTRLQIYFRQSMNVSKQAAEPYRPEKYFKLMAANTSEARCTQRKAFSHNWVGNSRTSAEQWQTCQETHAREGPTGDCLLPKKSGKRSVPLQR
jgi:hypothetical protein